VARALIVACGCRGRLVGEALLAEGWAVRGTSRSERRLAAIEAAGIEPAMADPDRPGTILELVADVTVVLYLLGSATGEPAALAAIHGPRLERLAEHLVDTPVRGFAYEATGSVGADLLTGGAEILRTAERTWRIPVALPDGPPPGDAGPEDFAAWRDSALRAVSGLLGPGRKTK
jgi:uncharacterized protein YbjT (DUF2867 family)